MRRNCPSPVLTNPLNSRRARLKLLHQRLEDIEARNRMAQPIPVLRCRTCSHPECGTRKPQSTPHDHLIIHMGCIHDAPTTSQP